MAEKAKIASSIASLSATVFGVGRLPFAPGTWGSLVALPLGYLAYAFGGVIPVLILIDLLFLLGWWASHRYAADLGESDPGQIVIDEVAGQLIVLAVIPPSLIGYGIAFIAFRAFDILKPWPISWIDHRMHGGLGIMLDDIVAGLIAAPTTLACLYILDTFR